VNVSAIFAVRSFTRSRDNSDCSFGLRLRTPDLGEEEAVRVGDGTVRKSVGGDSAVTFSLYFTRFRDIVAFGLWYSTFSPPHL